MISKKAVEVATHPAPSGDPTIDPALLTPGPAVESFMEEYLRGVELPESLREACAYALLGGGKRLRPILACHSARALGGSAEAALPGAAAIEMIHAFSLVHDDLPALDDDDLRRGRPTAHKQFGEAMAILAGDALMSLSFQIIVDSYEDAALAGLITREVALGTTRMIGGQVWDTLGGFSDTLGDLERVELIHKNKTGALICAACRTGALSVIGAGGERQSDLDSISCYGECVGLMFQIVDDLLDVEQSAEHTGKRTSKDSEAGKLTYPGVLGVERSRQAIEELRHKALESLEGFGANGKGLAEICDFLAVRTR